MIQPQRSHYVQDYQGVHADTIRNVVNWAPTLDLRYKISKVSQLRATYRASTSQPSITDLLDITDDSDPMNIKQGNPGLKPTFSHNFMLYYNGYGENLLDYNKFHSRLRIGLLIKPRWYSDY